MAIYDICVHFIHTYLSEIKKQMPIKWIAKKKKILTLCIECMYVVILRLFRETRSDKKMI